MSQMDEPDDLEDFREDADFGEEADAAEAPALAVPFFLFAYPMTTRAPVLDLRYFISLALITASLASSALTTSAGICESVSMSV